MTVENRGRLAGVGLGPGDAELVTLKAARLITGADVVAYHSARHGKSIARAIAEPFLREGQVEEALIYPVTVEPTTHPGGYRGAIDGFYDEAAARLAAHLDEGRNVVVLAEGDPLFYGSYIHMHKRLAHRYPTEVVPGITSVSAAAAQLGRPLAEGNEVFAVFPGTLPPDDIARGLAATDAAAILKLGRTFPGVLKAFTAAGRLNDAWYVERATQKQQRIEPLADVQPVSVPYFSLALVPSPLNASIRPPAPCRPVPGQLTMGEVVVVGLGPAGREWLTPEGQVALSQADDLVGYATYLDRVPVNPRQRRHASDNRAEYERAAFALDLAKRGSRVAVVSSGDPGVFAMASAVLEAACEPAYLEVPVRVLPGVTAANVVASRVGAPLGHDYCVISLSDRLKPWEVIEKRLAAAARADFAIAIYNPGSRSRTWQVEAARDVLLKHRAPSTPVVVGRDVGGPEEDVRTVLLADLEPAEVDMRTLLLIGSSMTRAQPRGETNIVFTPRRYPQR